MEDHVKVNFDRSYIPYSRLTSGLFSVQRLSGRKFLRQKAWLDGTWQKDEKSATVGTTVTEKMIVYGNFGDLPVKTRSGVYSKV